MLQAITGLSFKAAIVALALHVVAVVGLNQSSKPTESRRPFPQMMDGQTLTIPGAYATVRFVYDATSDRYRLVDIVEQRIDVANDITSVTTGIGLSGFGTATSPLTTTIPKWTGATTLGNSLITDDGTTITLGSLSITTLGDIHGR